jgi:putative transposase
VNFRKGWCGYLWQGCFASVAMDEVHLATATRHAGMSPVCAKFAPRAKDSRWS